MSLFDVQTYATQCEVCGATREPDQTHADACTYDRERDTMLYPGKRPRKCLNSYDPATAPFPGGY